MDIQRDVCVFRCVCIVSVYEYHIGKLLSFIPVVDGCGETGNILFCTYLRHSPLMGRGCQTFDHV